MKYVGKQKALAFAMMAMFASGSAHAAVDLNAGTGTLNYAKEYKFDDTTTPNFLASGTNQDVTAKMGTGLGTNKDYFARFTLSSGEWDLNGVTGVSSDLAGATVGTPYVAGNGTAIVAPVTTGTTAGTAANTITLSFAAGQTAFKSTATNKITGDVKVTMTLHETQVTANDGTSALSTSSGTYATFSKSIYNAGGTPPLDGVIDVKKASKVFEGDLTAVEICSISVDEATDVLLLDGSNASVTGPIEASGTNSVLKIKGNFAAATATNAVFATTNTVAPICGTTPPTADSATVELGTMNAAKTEVSFNIANLTAKEMTTEAAGTGAVSFCMITDGTTVIPTTAFSASYEPVAASGFAVGPIAIDGCNKLAKNGSTASVPLVLNAASTWAQMMRITNPSTLSGNVLITAVDDNGTVAPNTYTFNLPAGASTGLITIQNILDATGAVQLTDAATIGVGKINKLRLNIEAEFGTGHNGTSPDGVVVRTYVLPDANHGTFTQFQ